MRGPCGCRRWRKTIVLDGLLKSSTAPRHRYPARLAPVVGEADDPRDQHGSSR